MRHQFCMKTPLGVLVLPTCTRCGARNPGLTKDEDGAYTICDERVIRAVNGTQEGSDDEQGGADCGSGVAGNGGARTHDHTAPGECSAGTSVLGEHGRTGLLAAGRKRSGDTGRAPLVG